MKKWFYGVPGIEFVWHGTQADPELRYNGHRYNYYDLEDALWSQYCEEREMDGKDIDWTKGCSQNDDFAEWVLENADCCYGWLDEFTPGYGGSDVLD